ncbi:ATP-binding protein [Paraburkholderia fungorum]|uniref:ORC1/DEAH AAA+ ATPase domain-containing protein n=1 Tax=Paraburkholderia fungorum TaxID=134537 RepID=A0AAW3V0U4_9BURK|nr:ATP-binding protein [Paraburkholderia fungorum]MBB4518556.1 hypothetical protein [Paraburkholderia fungorum]MBB6204041.1 hypothetical protein [Paraburkholderia fungorum]
MNTVSYTEPQAIANAGDFGRVKPWLHPLFMNVDALGTPPLDEMYTVIRLVMVTGATSCAIAAPSGTGKTFAIAKFRGALQRDYGDIPVVLYNALNLHANTIRGFFKNFLYGLGYDSAIGETGDLRQRVTNYLSDAARQSGTSTVILMVDEAQELRELDMQFLKDIFNALHNERVRLVSLLFGEAPKFYNVAASWPECIDARFAQHKCSLRGLNKQEDIVRVLREIDSAPFSIGSDDTWTSTLFPAAYAAGFRLENEAPSFANALAKATRGKSLALPTANVFAAIKACVHAHWERDAADMVIGDDAWRQAVAWGRIAKAVASLSRGEPRIWQISA